MESSLQMPSNLDEQPSLESLGKEIEFILQEQRSKDRDLNIYRSGSAPPTVEGSLTAVGSLFENSNSNLNSSRINSTYGVLSEEEIRSHPTYLSFYYSHENLNPRLPPPLISKEDWRIAQRFQAGNSSFGGIGDRRNGLITDDGNSKSLFSLQPGLPTQNGKAGLIEPRKVTPRNLTRQSSTEWLERGTDSLIGLEGVGLGSRRKSLADIIQEGLGRPTLSGNLSRPISPFDDVVDPLRVSDPQLHNGMESVDSLPSRANTPGLVRVQSHGSSFFQSFASPVVPSPSRSTTLEPPLIGRSPGPCLLPVGGRIGATVKKNVVGSNVFNGVSSSMDDRGDIAATLSALSLSKNTFLDEEQKFDDQPNFSFDMSNGHGWSLERNLMDKAEAQMLTNFNVSKMGSVDPLYVQYMQRISDYPSHLNDPSLGRNYIGTSSADLPGLQKAYLGALIASQKQQYVTPVLGNSGGLNHGYYGSPTFGVGMAYPGNPMANSMEPGSPIRQNDRISHFPSMLRSSTGGSIGSWHSGNGGNMEVRYVSSLLEEFKNNKTWCFELSDIVDHVVEFSADQYGSRFIQQKLETATVEEKNRIFPEIILHARTLMIDVFGNYVIQKFFEHGSVSQRKELASQLTGHVLPLSLQMYGCRVIQKALEVVDVDQQTQMVAELDGSVMKCVRDQNGNHVIQKSIECVPQDRIQFIISAFYGQVVALSTHPYGCRVVQRVLEHCDNPNTQHIIMEEILQSISSLAQDQYGNYVVQHVLHHGKPHERSAIINKLAGQIVKMSQQKFASNVIEKCLTFGCAEERQLLVNEILGSTDENEPLQAMMKDPYGNYVVQKVLETCNNQSHELIVSRIKVHLNALKRYTYGKHIVARVEKLITTGERRIGIQT